MSLERRISGSLQTQRSTLPSMLGFPPHARELDTQIPVPGFSSSGPLSVARLPTNSFNPPFNVPYPSCAGELDARIAVSLFGPLNAHEVRPLITREVDVRISFSTFGLVVEVDDIVEARAVVVGDLFAREF